MSDAKLSELIKSEGDSREWEHAGLACRMARHDSMKHWCGYVGLPASHPSHGKGYDDIEADVHGGLTYARGKAPGVEPDGMWWVGFDCAHLGDLSPGMGTKFDRAILELGNFFIDSRPGHDGDIYRDASWVEAETNRLADQLSKARPAASVSKEG